MKLNKKVELGLKAVHALKTKVGPTRTEDLAVEVGTTVNFLEKIMHSLKLANIVLVKRGPGGGYTLNPLFGKLTAYHVAKAVGRDFGTIRFSEAPTDKLHKSIVEAYLNVSL